MARRAFFACAAAVLALIGLLAAHWPAALWLLVPVTPLVGLGIWDAFQPGHSVLRNFPLIGHGRYFMERVRPEVQQYFIESNVDAFPIEREFRSLVYQRAKGELETRSYGTQRDVYRVGYEWAAHSLMAKAPNGQEPRVVIGGRDCRQPYSASLLNVSAMSFGSLSKNALLALNRAAKARNFAHNTGEGGVTSYHAAAGGSLIWQVGTGYFGCRTKDGGFDEEQFKRQASLSSIRMIELKLSQGAKPGHGGILPGVKVTKEIAAFRGVEPGKTVFSPPGHSAFTSPIGLLRFIAKLRDLADGKPVGFKLCIGRRSDFFAICKAMLETGITPDFITVDGGEGGTAAAPLEFSNSVGMPGRDAWIFADSALSGVGLREEVKLLVSGKILSGFHMVRALALGADACMSARGMMLALGCIQSLRCNTNRCPTGVTTQDPALMRGLHVGDKAERVARFHDATVRSCLELVAAMGLNSPAELRPQHIFRRVDDLKVRNLGELYDFLEPGQLLRDASVPEGFREEWCSSRPDRWTVQPETGQYGGSEIREDVST
jgi:glutamate synthase domain-containing protein 2